LIAPAILIYALAASAFFSVIAIITLMTEYLTEYKSWHNDSDR